LSPLLEENILYINFVCFINVLQPIISPERASLDVNGPFNYKDRVDLSIRDEQYSDKLFKHKIPESFNIIYLNEDQIERFEQDLFQIR